LHRTLCCETSHFATTVTPNTTLKDVYFFSHETNHQHSLFFGLFISKLFNQFNGILLVKKNPDTAWFNLKNYDGFKDLSINEWLGQLEERAIIREMLHQDPPFRNRYINSSLEKKLSKSGVLDTYSNDDPCPYEKAAEVALLKKYPFSTASIDSFASRDLWLMTQNEDLDHVWKSCEGEENIGMSDPFNIGSSPIDFHIEQIKSDDSERMAHITINLSATDKQIQKDFTHWLTNYREAINYKRDKSFNHIQAKLDKLVKYRVIPYLDLLLVAKEQGKKITYSQIADLLFPNEPTDVDTKDRVEKVTKRLAEEIIRNQLDKILSIQIANEEALLLKS
jgi:hypothetical protein